MTSTMCSALICTRTIAAEQEIEEWTLGSDRPRGEIRVPQTRCVEGSDEARRQSIGDVWLYNCLLILGAGQPFVVPLLCQQPVPRTAPSEEIMHRRLQSHTPDWSAVFDWNTKETATLRRKFLGAVADTGTLILLIHFPNPTTGRIHADGNRFRYGPVR
jgi:hypothetical protein